MKRFFQRLDGSSSSSRDYTRQPHDQGGPSSHSSSGSFIGKVFVVGQYHCTVEDVIAEGGFSLVFLVKANNGIRYALKRLYVNNEHDLSICKREIEIARKLGSHKNIVQMVESSINYCGHDVHEIFMLMQYCKGQLLHLMNEKISTGFTETEIIRILCDLCEAISRMHRNDPPIIHRDLKVENILISDDGNYMLCDFGSATTKTLSLDSGQPALSIDEEIKRYTTLAYRSPEMVDVYSGKSINTKADIWALGCLVYKLCYFNLPFGESTLAIQNAQLTIPDTHSDRYSQRLSSLIAYMLLPDPDDRPDIYQVSCLAFSLTGNECPVKNLNHSSIPSWSDLRVPPTETQARELKRTALPTNDRSFSSGNLAANVYHQQANNTDNDKTSTTTTTVTPRQRPKASININSVLPTSPVAFQRSHTPSNNNEQTSNLSVKEHPGLTNSHSFTSSGQLFSKVDQVHSRPTDWSKVEKQSPTFASNPVLNINDDDNNSSNNFAKQSSALNHNPFITSLSVEETIDSSQTDSYPTNVPPPPPPPPPPPRNQSLTLLENRSSIPGASNSTNVTTTTHQHRRNMSDSSAFSIKNQDPVKQRGALELTTNNLSSQNQSVSNEFVDGGGNSQQALNRSLNPFDVTIPAYSFEDQLFGKEFDKIRSENQPTNVFGLIFSNDSVTGADHNPFEAAPMNQERLKRLLYKNQQNYPEKTTKIIITGDSDETKNVDLSNQKKSTVITIKSDKEFMIVSNNGQTEEPKIKSLFPVVSSTNNESGDQSSKIHSNKSISSSSQGGIATSPTANYMPLYSSDTAEDDDFDDHGLKLRHRKKQDDNKEEQEENEDIGLIMSSDKDHHMNPIHPFETSGDMTEPLVEDDEDEEIDHDSENPHSSIGSASDLITDSENDDDDDDDSQGVNDSSSESSIMKPVEDNSSEHDSDNDDEVPIKYGLVKNPPSSDLSIKSKNMKPSLNISRIQITQKINVNHNLNNTDDGTSISNSSMRSDSQKNIDSLDHLIGHVEGHRPLLEDEDEDDIHLSTTNTATSIPSSMVATKSLISMDQADITFDVSDSKYYHSKTASLPQFEKLNSFQKEIYSPASQVEMIIKDGQSKNSTDGTNPIHSDFGAITLTNQRMDEITNEENRRLDEEVERSLNSQVIFDQMNNKDLFGSIPFTNKELINHSIIQQETASVVMETNQPENTNRFENSFADIPVNVINQKSKNSTTTTTSNEQDPKFTAASAISGPIKSTDLFGAIPFSSSTQHSKTEIIKIPQLPPPTTKNLTSKVITLPPSAVTTVTAVSLQQISKPVRSKFVQSPTKMIATTGISSHVISQSAPTSTPSVATTALPSAGINKLSRNQFQRSNLKIKSKVAKKYEVDESDDEVDGLLDPLENDDLLLENDSVEPTLDSATKKKKKDKKEKSDKKSKDIKVVKEKKSKIKEKSDKMEKVKNKEEKKKEKEKKDKVKEKDKKKDKKDKESKDKSSKNISSTDPANSGAQPLSIISHSDGEPIVTKLGLTKDNITTSSSSSATTMAIPMGMISNKDGKIKNSSSKQAFANMSFEDEIQHHNQHLSTSNNSVTITRC